VEGMATGRPEFLDHASRFARSCAHGDLGPEHFVRLGVDDEALDLALAVLVPKSPPSPAETALRQGPALTTVRSRPARWCD
jgi:hypothetical protein